MQDWLFHRAQVSPTKLALVFENQNWSYVQLNRAVDRLCATLVAVGVTPGQHVAVLMPNCPEFVFAIHALARLGAVLVPLNTRLTGSELKQQITQADAQLLMVGMETESLAAQLDIESVNIQKASPAAASTIPAASFKLNNPQGILFTSGTTGHSKGVVLSFANHFYSATASAYRLGTLPTDRWLLCMPLYHVGGLAIVLRCCLYGTAVVLMARFDTESVAETLQVQQVSLISVVPTMLHRLLINNEIVLKTPHLRCILVGGAALIPQLADACISRNLPIAITYGLSEAASQVATAAPEDTAHKPGSVGKPLMFMQVRVVDAAGNPVSQGDVGEIVVSGPTVMRGYYRRPKATRQTLRDGWLFTGDLGYLDTDGDLWVVQRRVDLIVTGGENVYPAEVEQVLRTHPTVADACVVGLPDAEWGQQVAAAVVLLPKADASNEKLLYFCRTHLAGYKVPRFIHIVETLPQTASGKVRRDAVQRQLISATEAGT